MRSPPIRFLGNWGGDASFLVAIGGGNGVEKCFMKTIEMTFTGYLYPRLTFLHSNQNIVFIIACPTFLNSFRLRH